MASQGVKTTDIRVKIAIKKGTPLNTPTRPHLLAFECSVDHVGKFQSMEVTTQRDGLTVTDIGFYSFCCAPKGSSIAVKFQYNDDQYYVIEHDYLLDATLHFLT